MRPTSSPSGGACRSLGMQPLCEQSKGMCSSLSSQWKETDWKLRNPAAAAATAVLCCKDPARGYPTCGSKHPARGHATTHHQRLRERTICPSKQEVDASPLCNLGGLGHTPKSVLPTTSPTRHATAVLEVLTKAKENFGLTATREAAGLKHYDPHCDSKEVPIRVEEVVARERERTLLYGRRRPVAPRVLVGNMCYLNQRSLKYRRGCSLNPLTPMHGEHLVMTETWHQSRGSLLDYAKYGSLHVSRRGACMFFSSFLQKAPTLMLKSRAHTHTHLPTLALLPATSTSPPLLRENLVVPAVGACATKARAGGAKAASTSVALAAAANRILQ